MEGDALTCRRPIDVASVSRAACRSDHCCEPGVNLTEWARISAKSATRDVWLGIEGEGKPKIGGDPWYLPDGRTDVYSLLADWQPEKIPFPVWLAPYNRGKRWGDMLWTGGLTLKIASVRMIRALESANVTGYRTFDVDVRDWENSPVDGYVGFATDPAPGTDIQNMLGQKVQNIAFIATWRVVEVLRAHGADSLDIQVYDPSRYERFMRSFRSSRPGQPG